MSTNENNSRFIAVLNKKIPLGKLMNALGHMTAGLAGGHGESDKMEFLQYQDKDGNFHPHISNFPFIVLKADNSNQIRKVRQEAISRNLIFTDFTNTMTVGSSEEQLAATKNTAEAELEYFGVCIFGPTETLREFTGKFSLFN